MAAAGGRQRSPIGRQAARGAGEAIEPAIATRYANAPGDEDRRARSRTRSPVSEPRVRVGKIAQAVAEEIEAEHQQRDREPGKDRQVRRVEQVRAAAVQHRPPARRRRLHAEPEKTQRRFADDRAGHAERGLHDDRRNRGRHDVPQQHARRVARRARAPPARTRTRARAAPGRARAARSRPSRSPSARTARCRGSARAPRPARSPAAVRETPAACRSTRLITSSSHAAEVAGDRAEQRADDRRDADHDEADEKRDARAGEHAREDVAAQLVEAERMRAASDRPSRSGSSCAAGSNGVSAGPAIAASAATSDDGGADLQQHPRRSLIADPRIEQAVREIGQQVHRRRT